MILLAAQKVKQTLKLKKRAPNPVFIQPFITGYYCVAGSFEVTVECERGKYCEEGCEKPVDCPSGTYNPSLRGESSDSGTNCSAGTFCLETGRSEDGDPCEAGECWGEGEVLFISVTIVQLLH